MLKRKTIFQTLQLEVWAIGCSWPNLCLTWHPSICAIAQWHHNGYWNPWNKLEHHSCSRACPHQTNIQSSVHSLHHDGRWRKVQELHWHLYPAFGTGFNETMESWNHGSRPKIGSTLNSVPMAAATKPIRSSSHVEAKPSMPVMGCDISSVYTRQTKEKNRPNFWASNMGKL